MFKFIYKIIDKLEQGLSSKEKSIFIALLLVISALSIVLSFRFYHYIQKGQDFCNSCHLMGEAYTAWKLSAHGNIICQDCHRLSLIEKNVLLIKFVFTADRKTPEPHGAATPWKTCMECHWDEAAQGGLSVNKSSGHARHIFMEKLVCQDCHKRTVHAFRPDSGACGRCHQGREVHGLGKEQMSCLMCHPFLAKKQETARIDQNRDRCFACHKKISKTGFPEGVPMSRLHCYECHKPHRRVMPDDNDCLRCHSREVLAQKTVHKSDKHCKSCHVPHRWTATR